MKRLREIVRRLRVFAHREKFNAELREEMRLHLELREEQRLATGAPAEEAHFVARRNFGNITSLAERSRGAWGWVWFDHIREDVRYGWRILYKSPGFSVVAILTIALGIGATTAIFSVVDATLLHPLPYPEPDQLVRIQDDLRGVGTEDVGMSVPEWRDLQRSGIFRYVSPIVGGPANLTGASQPTRVRSLFIPPNYFATLGVDAELGRTFADPNDPTEGFTLEAVISDGLWKRSFAGDPRILGRSLRVDNDVYRVVGVMPPGFRDPGRTPEDRETDVWVAWGFVVPSAPPRVRSSRVLQTAIARLSPGLTIETAQSRMDALTAALEKQFPGDYPVQNGWKIRLVPLKENVTGRLREPLIVMLVAVGMVLLIGCVNITNLLLARASARGREIGVRQALGASRGRLIAQMLTESLLLSVIGGCTGVAILFSMKGLLLRIIPASLQGLNEISIRWPILIFAFGASVAAGALFGIAPALQAGRVDMNHALKQEGRGATGSGEQTRIRRRLVTAELALSVVLLIAAGLLLRSFSDLLNVELGFNPENAAVVHVWLPWPGDPNTDIYNTVAQEAPFLREILRRGKTLPGVEEIAVGNFAAIPLGHGSQDLNPMPIIIEGRDTPVSQAATVRRAGVTPEYFHLMGMRLMSGRLLNDFDDENAPPVALINDALARTYWPHGGAIGSHLRVRVGGNSTAYMSVDVIGVLADARTESLAQASIPEIYMSLYQRRAKDLAIFVRGHFGTAAISAELRQQVQSVNPELPVYGAQMLDETISESLTQQRFSVEIVGLFAVTALILAALGIYGVISYIVSERTHEIGIRMALGAESRSIIQLMLRQGLRLTFAGAAIGLACAFGVSHLMAGLLYGVRPTDWITFAGVVVLLMIVALLACYIPAQRAARVDPMIALRAE